MLMITAFENNAKRQAVSIVANAACYDACNQAVLVFQSIGAEASVLCAVPGSFALAMLNVYSCTSRHISDSGNATKAYPYLETPLSYCESYNGFEGSLTKYEQSESADSLANGISSLQDALSSSSSSYCSLSSAGSLTSTQSYISCTGNSTASPSTANTGAAASSLPLSTLSSMTSMASSVAASASGAASNAGLSTGAVAGIAVGATIAGILVIVFVIGFIWWYRRKHKKERATAVEREKLQDAQEKAQLHSDEYKPHREELSGSRGTLQIRTIDGLHEVEHQDLSRIRSEMSANEVAAAELNRFGSSQIGTDSTLIDPSDRADSRRQA